MAKKRQISQAFSLMSAVWGSTQGYVFLPHIDGDATTTLARKKRGYHENRAFRWPDEADEIKEHMAGHTSDDLYWCPTVFHGKRRITEQASSLCALFGDLDEASPRHTPPEVPPASAAWSTSPGRYQAVWLLAENDRDPRDITAPGGVNHRLTEFIEADTSGWDTTQLLRPPGWKNHKPDYRDDVGDSPTGRLLWFNGDDVYDIETFEKILPEVEATDPSLIDIADEAINSVKVGKVLKRIKHRIPASTRRLMQREPLEGDDRSEVLFKIECDLADAGATATEIIAIVRHEKFAHWNKHAGRADEMKRLRVEAAKAVDRAGEDDDEDWYTEVGSTLPTSNLLLYDQLQNLRPPEWIVQNVLSKGSCAYVAGAPKSMKSYFALDLALSCSTGLPFLDKFRTIHPGPVFLISGEDPARMTRRRMEQIADGRAPEYHPAGFYLETTDEPSELSIKPGKKPEIYGVIRPSFTLNDPASQDWLSEQLEERDYSVVILDTFLALAGDLEENRSLEVNQVLNGFLKQIAEAYDVAVVMVHHTRKATEGRRGGNLLGAQAHNAWWEEMIYLEKVEPATPGADVYITMELESKVQESRRYFVQPRFAGEHEHYAGAWRPQVTEDDPEPSGSVDPSAPQTPALRDRPENELTRVLDELGSGQWHSGDVVREQFTGADRTFRSQRKRLLESYWMEYNTEDDAYRLKEEEG